MKSYSAMESVWQIAIPKTVRSVGICVCLSFLLCNASEGI